MLVLGVTGILMINYMPTQIFKSWFTINITLSGYNADLASLSTSTSSCSHSLWWMTIMEGRWKHYCSRFHSGLCLFDNIRHDNQSEQAFFGWCIVMKRTVALHWQGFVSKWEFNLVMNCCKTSLSNAVMGQYMGQWPRHALRHVRDARAVMHVAIAYPRWRGKRSRHSRRMCNPQFYVPGKRPMTGRFWIL